MSDDRESDWMFDPELASIDRRLRREIREENEEVEAIVAESELRARTFAEVALDARNRGDRVTIATAQRKFTGQILVAGRDFVTLKTDSFEVDVNTAGALYLRTVDTSRAGGRATEEAAGSFEMRLVERKSPNEKVEVGYRLSEETVLGRIVTVAQDHIRLIDDHGGEWSILLDSLSYVIRRPRGRLI